MSRPRVETIARTGRGTRPDGSWEDGGPATWADVEAELRRGASTTWLSVRGGTGGGVHTRPVFAAWTGSSVVFTTKGSARKTGHLAADGDVSLAVDLGGVHLVLEGHAVRLTDRPGLERAREAMREVYGWPTEVAGDELDAEYGAPTSGGPPYQAWEITPAQAFCFPTRDQVEPTRFTF